MAERRVGPSTGRCVRKRPQLGLKQKEALHWLGLLYLESDRALVKV